MAILGNPVEAFKDNQTDTRRSLFLPSIFFKKNGKRKLSNYHKIKLDNIYLMVNREKERGRGVLTRFTPHPSLALTIRLGKNLWSRNQKALYRTSARNARITLQLTQPPHPQYAAPASSLNMSKLADYTILPLTIRPTAAFPTPASHTLYLRPHEPKIPTDTDSRSLFIVNVPVDSTFAHFRAIFTSLVGAGKFESITFDYEKSKAEPTSQVLEVTQSKGKKRKRNDEVELDTELPQIWDRKLGTSGGSAVVLLADEKSVEVVLKAVRKLHKSSKSSKWPVWGEGVGDKVPALGTARYLSHQKLRYPDESTLQASVDAFMTSWSNLEEEKARLAKRQRNVPDEDGFVTVTRGGRTGPARKEDAEEKRRELEEKEQKKREEMGDFYRFQMRERRKAEQGELVKRFEEDKKRVETMKEKRGRFRPER